MSSSKRLDFSKGRNALSITEYREGMMLESQAGWGVGQEGR